MPDVLALAERLGAPVLTTFKAKGLVADHHPLACGVLGRSGTPVARWLMNESRPARGVRRELLEPHRVSPPYKPIVQVDDDPMAIGRFHPVRCRVLGDVAVTAEASCSPRSRDGFDRGRPARRCRGALGAVAGREGAPTRLTTVASASAAAAVFAALSAPLSATTP